MNLKDILSIIVVLVLVGFSWFIIKKLFFWALILGGGYVAYRLFVSNKKQIKE